MSQGESEGNEEKAIVSGNTYSYYYECDWAEIEDLRKTLHLEL
jgi:hypothetical protein